MLKIPCKENKEKHAILLNHGQLINKAYSVSDKQTYELRAELFEFQPKPIITTTTRKRKRKHVELNKNENVAETENIANYLEQLPEPTTRKTTTTLDRCWEAAYELPQLHGANLSSSWQEFRTCNQNFIIPTAARFYNHNVEQMGALLPQLLPCYDLIVLDPPWRNKYIRRLKRARQQLGYAMLDNEQLALLPLAQLIHKHTLVAIWCTNCSGHQQTLEAKLLPSWGLRLLHKLRWYKLNTQHELISQLNEVDVTQKQPYETLYLACHKESELSYCAELRQTQLLLSVPSIIHSHKPPLLCWLREHLKLAEQQLEPNCLELFARYLQPQFTSIGLEVLKLMDERLYNKV
ncbi:CG14906 [Drosophila busckii]|uniref:CG14906 n=1 Tax=Drosophila busckii TaxID=30019 RepID=A0A0M3QXD3_DROBS|nr:N(6)-adenine-specific DNA methyltransferase METTL4 [Drosophila busckii]ALC45669.1 CG14906 [Drosophila busckii]